MLLWIVVHIQYAFFNILKFSLFSDTHICFFFRINKYLKCNTELKNFLSWDSFHIIYQVVQYN